MENNGITITIGGPDEAKSGGMKIAKYGVGKKCRGKVVNFKPYGFFVETEDGGFGLVHGRNINGWDWSQRFDRVFRHGSEVEVTVIDIEAETNRMSFSCDMPAQAEEQKEPEPAAPAPTRREIADQWSENEPEKSQAAFEWLKRELEDGPIYGPLTTILCDRFEVPVPVSHWIRHASALLTDFSSVMFDFLYLKKPVVCWIPDRFDLTLSPADREKVMAADRFLGEFVGSARSAGEAVDRLVALAADGYALSPEQVKAIEPFFSSGGEFRRRICEAVEKGNHRESEA